MVSRKKLFALIAIGLMVLPFFNFNMILPSLPAIQKSLNASREMTQMLILGTMLVFSLSQFLYGPISDHFGRKKTAILGLIIFTAGTLACYLSNNIFILLAARIIQGFGVASFGAVTPAILSDLFSGKALQKAFSVMTITIGSVPIAAPIIGGYLQHYYGWQTNFLFILGLAVILLLLVVFVLEETMRTPYKDLHPKKILDYYATLSQKKIFLCLTGILMFSFSGQMIYNLSTPFLFQHILGFSAIMNGWLIFVTVIGLIMGGILSSYLLNWISVSLLIGIAIMLEILSGAFMLLFSLLDILNAAVIVIPMAGFMVGLGVTLPNCFSQVMDAFPKHSGMTGALMTGLQFTGTAIISVLFNTLLVHNQTPLASALVIFGIGSIILFLFSLRELKHS